MAITAWGAGGGGSAVLPRDRVDVGYAGGAGGVAIVEVDVVPGSSLLVVPGRGGMAGGSLGAGTWTAEPAHTPWLGGGGAGAPIAGPSLPTAVDGDRSVPGCRPIVADAAWVCTGAGAGGGWSGVFLGDALDQISAGTALVVAGGGGGGGAGGPGGAGGGEQGDDAPACGVEGASFAGRGGGPRAPGVLGVRATTLDDPLRLGGSGAPLLGGSGGHASPHLGLTVRIGSMLGGGGGGGGWFGGSGGASVLSGHSGCGGGGGGGFAPGGHLSTGAAPDLPAEGGAAWGAAGRRGAGGGHGGVRIQW